MKQDDKKAEVSNEEMVSIQKPGTVINCFTLHLRAKASKESESLAILKLGEKVTIVDSKADDFYQVRTAAGLNGYCMKSYVSQL